MSVALDEVFGCELYQGRTTASGYGREGKIGAHVAAWEREFGPVPEGFVLDHLCGVRNCRALHHLQAVTQSENLLRRSWAYRCRIKLCPKGHDLKVHAVVMPQTKGRVCRQCNREAGR